MGNGQRVWCSKIDRLLQCDIVSRGINQKLLSNTSQIKLSQVKETYKIIREWCFGGKYNLFWFLMVYNIHGL
jgi:hypothetical protein